MVATDTKPTAVAATTSNNAPSVPGLPVDPPVVVPDVAAVTAGTVVVVAPPAVVVTVGTVASNWFSMACPAAPAKVVAVTGPAEAVAATVEVDVAAASGGLVVAVVVPAGWVTVVAVEVVAVGEMVVGDGKPAKYAGGTVAGGAVAETAVLSVAVTGPVELSAVTVAVNSTFPAPISALVVVRFHQHVTRCPGVNVNGSFTVAPLETHPTDSKPSGTPTVADVSVVFPVLVTSAANRTRSPA